jgi:flagellar biosynthesis/type III secretory pathway protein FliH
LSGRSLFGGKPGDNDVRPLVERLPAVGPQQRGALPIAGATPMARPLFGAPPPAPTVAAAPAAPAIDQAALERELAQLRADTEQSARAAVAAEAEVTLGRYAASIKALDRAIQQAAKPPVDDLVELAMIIAREIVGRELVADRDHLVATLDEALSLAGDDHPTAVVRMNGDDVAYMKERHGDSLAGLEVVADPKLAPGGCVVETPRAVVDASIEAKMAAVRKAVTAALAGGESS